MMKWIGSLILAGLTGIALAQAPFTIVRPPDGAKVRETVHVLIPKGSIPDGGYIGVFLGGKFLEATLPPLKGKYYDYELNTKALGLPDTEPGKPLKLELVLYVDYNEKSRIVDRSSVDINIGNQANIPIPNAGIRLRYNFVPGTKMVYLLEQKVAVSPISEEDNSKGGRAAEFTADGETIRLSYEVMNSYPDGDGLMRMQPFPEKGKDYALLTASGEQQRKWFEWEMAPIYMRLHPTGQEVFGSIPEYVPLEGSSGSNTISDLFAAFPLPTLPSKPVHVGDSWQSQFQEGAIDLNNRFEIDSLVDQFPARGEFVDTEWEQGHPCAKIRHVIEAGTKTKRGQKLKASGAEFGDDKISLEETIYFALDTHQVLKIIRDMTLDRRMESGQMGGMGGNMGPGAGAGTGMPGATQGGDFAGPGSTTSFQKGGFMRGAGGGGRAPGGPGGPGMGGPGMGAGGAASATFIRIRFLQTFTLESN